MGKKKKQEKTEKQKEKQKKQKKFEKQERERSEKREKEEREREKAKKLEKVKAEKLEKEKQEKRAKAEKKSPDTETERKPGRMKKPAAVQARDKADAVAERFRALGDENRLRILELLRDRELCAGDLLKSMDIVQSTLSHHMKILVESGIVKCRKQGKWSYYSVDRGMREKLDILIGEWT